MDKSQTTEPEVKAEGEEKKSLGKKIVESVFGKKEDVQTDPADPTAEDKKDDLAAEAITKEQMDAAVEQARQDAVDSYVKEQEEKARKEALTPEELKSEEEQAKDVKLAKLEHDLLVRECKDSAIKTLDTAKLPVSLADIVDYTTKETAEASLLTIQKVYTEALEQGIKERLKGKTPEGLTATATINDIADVQARARKAAGLPEKKD